MDINELWKEFLEKAVELATPFAFRTYLKPLKPLDFDGSLLKLSVREPFLGDWITTHYKDLIEDILSSLRNERVFVEIVSGGDHSTASFSTRKNAARANQKQESNANLCRDYLFETFVVGESNQFAFATAKAVATDPGKQYNPLLIYSESGLGKTHLLQAIGNHIRERFPERKVLYLTSEQFTNEYVQALSRNRIKSFQKKIRSADVLLLDDIQFFAGKTRSSEEFFHTFNTLYESRCQLVFSSDRPPKDITQIETRLRTRLEWGLLADIQAPSLETKMAILDLKRSSLRINIPDDVIEYVASQPVSNIRELEGAFLKLVAAGTLTSSHITVQTAKSILKEFISVDQQFATLSVEIIKNAVAEYYNINPAELSGRRRNKSIVLPRHIAMYLSRKHTTQSLPEIGREFGGKDHVTVLHAHKKIQSLLQNDDKIKQDIDHIERSFSG